MTTVIRHPFTHDMHYGAPNGCSRHEKLPVGSYHSECGCDASEVVQLIMGRMCTNKMLRYLGCWDGEHRYIYSYDTYTLGVVGFKADEEPGLLKALEYIVFNHINDEMCSISPSTLQFAIEAIAKAGGNVNGTAPPEWRLS